MTFLPQPYLLTNKIQHYAWGERGQSAYIARLLGLQQVDQNTPFAELWMGTHPLGASTLEYEGRQMPLSELVEHYPVQVLGKRVAATFANQFPFLLKVLSANEPLSIQLHPSKGQAVALHAKDPANYPDDNHKPEIAIALDKLDALAGVRSSMEMEALVSGFPALGDFVAFDSFADQPKQETPRLAFISLLRNAIQRPQELAQVIQSLAGQLRHNKEPDYRERLFLELVEKYPGDVGLLSIFFLTLHTLTEGQGMFIPAGVPHAYLKGNIVECMASSDNVIRAGLTPKFKDIPALLEMATDQAPILYSPKTPSYAYSSPANEFRVGRHELQAGKTITDTNDGVRLLLALRGRLRLTWQGGRLEIAPGQAVLLPGSLHEVEIECLEAGELYIVDVP